MHKRLRPLLTSPLPSPATLIRTGAWRGLPFLLRPLGSVLARAGLPPRWPTPWPSGCGRQTTAEAPSPLAFVASVLHGVGAYYPEGGLDAVPTALEAAAVEAGSSSCTGRPSPPSGENGRARGVETGPGTTLEADAVVSNRNGVGTYLEFAPDAVPGTRRRRRKPPAPVARRLCVPGRPRRSRPPISASASREANSAACW